MTRHHPLPALSHPEPTPADPAASSDSASPETEHLESIEVEQLEAEASPGPAAPDGSPLAAGGFLSVEAWAAGLRHALTLGGHLTGLQALLASPDAPTFPDAARAMYETIEACPPLHFLIRPGGLWIQRAAAVMVWAVPVASGVRAELRARQAVPVEESRQAAA